MSPSSSDKPYKPIECYFYRGVRPYLPLSYEPASCRNYSVGIDDPFQWAWSVVNIVVVSATTLINTGLILVVVFLWLVNRQFHFKKKHSYDKLPLQPLKKASEIKRRVKSHVSKRLVKSKQSGEEAEKNFSKGNKIGGSDHSNYRSFQSFLDDFEEEGDNLENVEAQADTDVKPSVQSNRSSLTSPTSSAKQGTKDLLHVASKIEVFSYLSPESLNEISSHVEYLDFPEAGDVVFDRRSLDGSLYAVVSGQVSVSLSILDNFDASNGDVSKTYPCSSRNRCCESNNPCFSYAANPGDIITSMLTLLTTLIREYHVQNQLLLSRVSGGISRKYNDNGRDDNTRENSAVPLGVNVRAVVSCQNTRLLRVPSHCFLTLLEKFPDDVCRICQTILARLQRVTIQTLYNFLGLGGGILGTAHHIGPSYSFMSSKRVRRRRPREHADWLRCEQSLRQCDINESKLQSLLDLVIPTAGALLGFPDETHRLLRETSEIVFLAKGSVLYKTGESPDSIYLVLKGELEVGILKNETRCDEPPCKLPDDDDMAKVKQSRVISSRPEEKNQIDLFDPLFTSGPGTFVGLLACLTSDASFITVRNSLDGIDAMLLKISSKTFENVISNHPRSLILSLFDIIDSIGDGESLTVSPAMYLFDWSLDWMHVEAGEHVAISGEVCDSIFVVLNGRLRSGNSYGKETSKSLLEQSELDHDEFGRGATIGELEALAGGRWAQSVYAIRHSELSRVPMSVLSLLMEMFPSSGFHFAKVVAAQVQSRKRLGRQIRPQSLLPSYGLSLATVAVVPLGVNLDISEFCLILTKSFQSIAPTKLLKKEEVRQRVGEELFRLKNSMLKVKMTRILGDIEENSRLVIYEADMKYTWWTKLCIQQADCVLLLVDLKSILEFKQVEACLAWAHKVKNVRIELVAIKSSSKGVSSFDSHASDELNNWSESRSWISKHHVVRTPFAHYPLDVHRMCRRISGQSIGLVLGGGGARGLAHLGVIKALNEAGIPVDMVGGTSQGAFIGALLARSPDDFEHLISSVREMATNMASIKEKILDLTFPITSFFSGRRFNAGIQKILGDIRIQDFVLHFFCVSVDIRNSRQMVHTKGVAWKYVRASMSLSGYLPPVSENNCLLVDGGYMNVVPSDVMAQFGAKTTIAVDVSFEKLSNFFEYGAELSGLWLLWNSWNPFVQTVKVPSMGDISERLAWVSSERMKKFTENKADLFLKPPVQDYGVLEFDKFDEIVKIGYDYAKPIVSEWALQNGYCAERV